MYVCMCVHIQRTQAMCTYKRPVTHHHQPQQHHNNNNHDHNHHKPNPNY